MILLHLIATWFFIHAFTIFYYVYDVSIVEIFRSPEDIEDSGLVISEVVNSSVRASFSGTIGLVVAFIISLTLSIRQKIYWLNSVIVFITLYAFGWFDWLAWKYVKDGFLSPGQLFNNIRVEFLVNGSILLSIGLLIFFLKPVNLFIKRYNDVIRSKEVIE